MSQIMLFIGAVISFGLVIAGGPGSDLALRANGFTWGMAYAVIVGIIRRANEGKSNG